MSISRTGELFLLRYVLLSRVHPYLLPIFMTQARYEGMDRTTTLIGFVKSS